MAGGLRESEMSRYTQSVSSKTGTRTHTHFTTHGEPTTDELVCRYWQLKINLNVVSLFFIVMAPGPGFQDPAGSGYPAGKFILK